MLIRLDAIVFDAGTQVRAAISETVVAQYAERMSEGDKFPPVVLFHDGNHYYMADGFHRGLASQRVGFKEIDATVQKGTKTDALWFALGANKAHAYQMTTVDKRHAILLALQTWPERSQNQIAAQIGVAQSWVSDVRKQVIGTDNLPSRVTGKDGKSYPASQRDRSNRPERALPPSSTGKVSKSPLAVQARRNQMRAMAADGHTSRQIAAAVGVSEENCRTTLRAAGIDVPGDRATKGTHRHDSTRIIEHMVMDAENLTADVGLIDFDNIDKNKLPAWLDSLKASRDNLNAFIRRLMEERKKHVEAA